MIIDATNTVVGRLASFVAKKVMLGESVNIVNCENAVFTGSPSMVAARYKRKIDMGIPLGGPYFPKQSDRIVRRTIRGMLPHQKRRGRDLFKKKVMCHIGVPEKFASQKMERIPNADVSKLTTVKYMYLKDLVKHLGGKL